MLNHEVAGEQGPWLVFVHGFTGSRADWQAQREAFAGHCRCLLPDLRGHGASAAMDGPFDIETMAADVVALLGQYEMQQAVLVGHSMGVRIAAAAAIQCPARVGGLVLVDGSRQAVGDPLEARDEILGKIGPPEQVGAFLDWMFTMMFTDDTPAELRDFVMQRALAMSPATARTLFGNMVGWDAGRMPAAMSLLQGPVAAIQSTDVSPARVRRPLQPGDASPFLDTLRGWIPHLEANLVYGVGHFTQTDAAQEVNQVIERMLAQVAAAR